MVQVGSYFISITYLMTALLTIHLLWMVADIEQVQSMQPTHVRSGNIVLTYFKAVGLSLLADSPNRTTIIVFKIRNCHWSCILAYGYAEARLLVRCFESSQRCMTANQETRSIGSSRPRTPPSIDTSRKASASPATSTGTKFSPPPRLPYSSIVSRAERDWLNDVQDQDQDDVLEDEDDDELLYDDDEDEFGLPSLTSMRRKQSKRQRQGRSKDSGGSAYNGGSTLAPPSLHPRTGSFDIGDERNALSYPTTKKSEGKILRPQYKDILRDPASSLHLINHAPLPPGASPKETEAHTTHLSRISKFKRILQASTVSLSDLRSSAWSGVPEEVRAMTWQILLGYLPTNSERRVAVLERKRKEYLDGVKQAFNDSSGVSKKPYGTRSVSMYQGRTLILNSMVMKQHNAPSREYSTSGPSVIQQVVMFKASMILSPLSGRYSWALTSRT